MAKLITSEDDNYDDLGGPSFDTDLPIAKASKYLDRKCPNCRAKCMIQRTDGNLECDFCRETWRQGPRRLIPVPVKWVSGCEALRTMAEAAKKRKVA